MLLLTILHNVKILIGKNSFCETSEIQFSVEMFIEKCLFLFISVMTGIIIGCIFSVMFSKSRLAQTEKTPAFREGKTIYSQPTVSLLGVQHRGSQLMPYGAC